MNTVDYDCSELESILYTYIKELVRKLSLFLSLFPFLCLLTHPKSLYSSFPFPSSFPPSLDSSLYLPLSFPSFLFSFFSPSISSFSLRFSFHCWNRLKRNTMTRAFPQYMRILVLNVLVTSAIGVNWSYKMVILRVNVSFLNICCLFLFDEDTKSF